MPKMKPYPDLKFFQEYLSYDKDKGDFTWLKGNRKGLVAGCKATNGYVYIMVKERGYLAHRLAFIFMGAELPVEVDHKNRNRSDNRWENLRPATTAQNGMNKGLLKNNKTGFTGVTWRQDKKKFCAAISRDSGRIHIGYYNSAAEAAEAYRNKVKEVFGEEWIAS